MNIHATISDIRKSRKKKPTEDLTVVFGELIGIGRLPKIKDCYGVGVPVEYIRLVSPALFTTDNTSIAPFVIGSTISV